MADITPSQIVPLGDGSDARDDLTRDKDNRKAPAKPAPAPPQVDSDEKEEPHQLDELA
jgi:hypothetical protein